MDMALARAEGTGKIFSAKKHQKMIIILFFCILYVLHEQKKTVAAIFLDFQGKEGMHH
jgi:hypothetical protein